MLRVPPLNAERTSVWCASRKNPDRSCRNWRVTTCEYNVLKLNDTCANEIWLAFKSREGAASTIRELRSYHCSPVGELFPSGLRVMRHFNLYAWENKILIFSVLKKRLRSPPQQWNSVMARKKNLFIWLNLSLLQ